MTKDNSKNNKHTPGDLPRPSRQDQIAMIQESIVAMSKRREWLADHYLPESTPGQIFGEDGDLTPEQEWGLMAINALEEEYVLDPELRERISLITFTDD